MSAETRFAVSFNWTHRSGANASLFLDCRRFDDAIAFAREMLDEYSGSSPDAWFIITDRAGGEGFSWFPGKPLPMTEAETEEAAEAAQVRQREAEQRLDDEIAKLADLLF